MQKGNRSGVLEMKEYSRKKALATCSQELIRYIYNIYWSSASLMDDIYFGDFEEAKYKYERMRLFYDRISNEKLFPRVKGLIDEWEKELAAEENAKRRNMDRKG